MIINPSPAYNTSEHLTHLERLKRALLKSRKNASGNEALVNVNESIEFYSK